MILHRPSSRVWVPWALLTFCAAAGAADRPPGAFELLEQVRTEYARLGASGEYRDRGEIEIHASGDSVPFTRRFETRTFPEGGFRLSLETDPEGAPTRVLWRDGEGTFHYDAARGEILPSSSPAAELPRFLPAGGVDALAVPALLLGLDPWLDPEGASLEVDGDRFVLYLSRLGGGLETRVWIEGAGDGRPRIVRLESDLAVPEPIRIRATYRPETPTEPEPAHVVYAPPADARPVDAWSRSEPDPRVVFGDVVSVDLLTLVVRVTELGGTPIPGLGVDDFRVTVRGSEEGRRLRVPVAAVDWISSQLGDAGGEPRESARIGRPGDPPPPAPTREPEVPAPDRRVVLFVQADKNGERVGGHLRLLPQVVELVDSFPPGDRLAVVGFDSHLKLWQDFTRDRRPVREALSQAILFGGTPPAARRSALGSLGRAFDFAAARRAATPEKALELTGRALAALPGDKEMIYVGWGLGRYGRGGVRMTWEYEPALAALHDAGVTVHVLDVSRADYHDLEIGLRQVARETGGVYLATFRHPEVALKSLSETLSAYYLLRLDRGDLPRSGSLHVELAPGVRGRLMVRPVSLAPEPVAP